MKKRILSLLLAVLFIFTLSPSVFATNDMAWNAQTDTEVTLPLRSYHKMHLRCRSPQAVLHHS